MKFSKITMLTAAVLAANALLPITSVQAASQPASNTNVNSAVNSSKSDNSNSAVQSSVKPVVPSANNSNDDHVVKPAASSVAIDPSDPIPDQVQKPGQHSETDISWQKQPAKPSKQPTTPGTGPNVQPHEKPQSLPSGGNLTPNVVPAKTPETWTAGDVTSLNEDNNNADIIKVKRIKPNLQKTGSNQLVNNAEPAAKPVAKPVVHPALKPTVKPVAKSAKPAVIIQHIAAPKQAVQSAVASPALTSSAAQANAKLPQTGNSHASIWLSLLGAGLAALGAGVLSRKRE